MCAHFYHDLRLIVFYYSRWLSACVRLLCLVVIFVYIDCCLSTGLYIPTETPYLMLQHCTLYFLIRRTYQKYVRWDLCVALYAVISIQAVDQYFANYISSLNKTFHEFVWYSDTATWFWLACKNTWGFDFYCSMRIEERT